MLFFPGVMRRVAVETSDIAAGVGGLRKMGLLVTFAVAGQTAGTRFLPGNIFEREYLGFIAAAVHMVRSRTMAALATLVGGGGLFIQCRLPVRCLLPGVVNVFVTGLAGLRSHVLGAVGRRRAGHRRAGGFRTLVGNLLASLAWSKGGDDEKK